MADEFVPDLVCSCKDELGQEVDIVLNGQMSMGCMEARVKWASFEGPCFGELIVRSEDGGLVCSRKPRLGEFEINGGWCHFVCGQVEIKLTERGKELLEIYKKVSD